MQSIHIDETGGGSSYVWLDFAYDSAGRVMSWTGASGPVASALSTRDPIKPKPSVGQRLLSRRTGLTLS